jgi:hypothetical protein
VLKSSEQEEKGNFRLVLSLFVSLNLTSRERGVQASFLPTDAQYEKGHVIPAIICDHKLVCVRMLAPPNLILQAVKQVSG